MSMLFDGRRNGSPGTPVAFETKFGWVLTGKTEGPTIPTTVAAHHVTLHCLVMTSSANSTRLRNAPKMPRITPQEGAVVCHFLANHKRNRVLYFRLRELSLSCTERHATSSIAAQHNAKYDVIR